MILLTRLAFDPLKVQIVLMLIVDGKVVFRFDRALSDDLHEIILMQIHDERVLCCNEVEVDVP